MRPLSEIVIFAGSFWLMRVLRDGLQVNGSNVDVNRGGSAAVAGMASEVSDRACAGRAIAADRARR
jgi:hypothetical protein